MLFDAFVTSRIDYCDILLAGALKAMTDKLQRLLNVALFTRYLRDLLLALSLSNPVVL